MSPRLLTIAQAAEELAVTERYIRHLIYRRRIQYVKLGRLVRIPQNAVDLMVLEGTVESEAL
ncbi:MAG: excisionase family DNA-binding protein [Actinomycetota bacterium]